MASEVADLWILLRANAAGFTAPVRQAGEAATRTEAQVLGMGEATASTSRRAVGAFSALGLSAGLSLGVAAAAFIHLGNAYQDSLNTLQAVTHATNAEMARVSATASRLGADLTLPATSAADAAAAMTELAKGGLSVGESMEAAKGTLQLAAAAQVDGAQAAQIQANALNEFRLGADQASHVADVLANTANAATGEITDMATALTYVGPVAHAVGVSIDDTATAIGLLAKNGILGDMAGTSLRTAIASLAGPSKRAATGMRELNLEAFDQSGRFIGLRALTDQLAAAKGRLTDKEFQSAAAHAFGRESLAAINILASEGATAFDKMSVAVSHQGGAAELAAAKTKGLGGAWQGFISTTETLALQLYSELAPGLEGAVRGLTSLLGAVEPVLGVFGDLVSAVGAVTGFLNHHHEVVAALATVYVARLIPALITSAATMDGALGRAIVGGTLGLSRMAGSATAAATRLAAFGGSTAGVFGMAGALAIGLGVHMWNTRQKIIDTGKALQDSFSTVDSTTFADLNANLDGLGEHFVQLDEKAKKHHRSMFGTFSFDFTHMFSGAKNAEKELESFQGVAAQTRSNVYALSASLGITEDAVVALAAKAGIDLTQSFTTVNEQVATYRLAQLQAADPTKRLAEDMRVLADQASLVTDQVKALQDSFDELLGKQISAHEATHAYNVAMQNLREALVKSHGAINDNAGAAGEAGEAFGRAASKAHAAAVAMMNLGNEKGAEAALRRAIAQLQPFAERSSYAREMVDGLKRELAQLPGAATGAAKGMQGAAPQVAAAAKKATSGALSYLLAAKLEAMVAGGDFSKGYARGITGAEREAIIAATTMAGHTVTAVRNVIQAMSPSRATMELGHFFGEGFAVGITDTVDQVVAAASGLATAALGTVATAQGAGVSASDIAAAAVRANTTDVGRAETARDTAVAGSLSARQAADAARAKVTATRAADAAAQTAYANERRRYDALTGAAKQHERARLDAARRAAEASADARRKAEADYATAAASARDAARAAQDAQRALADAVYASQVDSARTAAEVIQGQLEKVLDSARSFQDAFRNAVTSGTSLGDVFKADTGVASASDALARMQQMVDRGRQFAADLSELGALGLSGPLLQQIMAAGTEQGDQIARALIDAGASAVADFNSSAADLSALANTGVTGLAGTLFGDQAAALQTQLASTVAGFDELTAVLTEASAAISGTFGGPITSAPAGAGSFAGGTVTGTSGGAVVIQPAPVSVSVQPGTVVVQLDSRQIAAATYDWTRQQLIRDSQVGRYSQVGP